MSFVKIYFFLVLASVDNFDLFEFKNDYSISSFEFTRSIKDRYLCPDGYTRTVETENSFASYLRNLPLKKQGSKVKYFDGNSKLKKNVYDAVVDLPIGKKDLHQCADAVMRLRAEYLFAQKDYEKIHFKFTNGFDVPYSKWKDGYRIAIKGNKTSWVKKAQPSSSYDSFWNYLEQIFQYAGTASLEKELIKVNTNELQIGDIFIKGGFPGHAVIVVDKAISKKNKVVFMLAQSYMPAQEIQVLVNPNNSSLSPWYSADFGDQLISPEWTFLSTQLKRFP